jgi:hypothetical protein
MLDDISCKYMDAILFSLLYSSHQERQINEKMYLQTQGLVYHFFSQKEPLWIGYYLMMISQGYFHSITINVYKWN